MHAVDCIVENQIGRPESDERDACLHQDALEDMPVNVMPEFVGQNGFNFIGGVVGQQRVGQNNPASVAQAGKRGVRLFAFLRKLPLVNSADPRARALPSVPGAPLILHSPGARTYKR